MNRIDFTATLSAAKAYRKHEDNLDAVITNEELELWMAERESVSHKLRSAFADDTADFNRRDVVMRLNPSLIVSYVETGHWE